MVNNLWKPAFIAVGIVLCALRASGSSTCDKTDEDLHFPHPSDCSKYYRCVYGRKVLKICPEKMLFKTAIGNCDLYYNVDCQDKSQEYSEEDLTEVIENLTGRNIRKLDTPTTESNFLKDVEENTKFVYVPHEEEYNAYYKYELGEKFLMYCDNGMIFDFDLEICV